MPTSSSASVSCSCSKASCSLAFPAWMRRAMKSALATPGQHPADRRHRLGGRRPDPDLADPALAGFGPARQKALPDQRDREPPAAVFRRNHVRWLPDGLRELARRCSGALWHSKLPTLRRRRFRHVRSRLHTLSHRLRPLMACVRCCGARLSPRCSSAPASARGPDGIADVAEKVIDAVVNISTTADGRSKNSGGRAAVAGGRCRNCRRARRSRSSSTTSSRTAAAVRAASKRRHAAAQDQFARLRLHHRHLRHRRHQQPRHRRCRRDQRHHERRHQDQGGAGRRRQEDRSGGAEVQAAGEAADRGEVRRFREAAARRMGDRDRQSVQPRRHRHRRHRLGAQPRHQHRPL